MHLSPDGEALYRTLVDLRQCQGELFVLGVSTDAPSTVYHDYDVNYCELVSAGLVEETRLGDFRSQYRVRLGRE